MLTCLVSSVSKSLFSSISGLGLKGDREKRRKEASCGEMPARAIRS
jgi:hypothetical protein